MELIPIDAQEIAVGTPLPWALYDKGRALLVGEGAVIKSAEQLEKLSKHGVFREVALDAFPEAAQRPPAPGPRNNDDSAAIVTLLFSDMKLKGGERLQIEPPAILTQERLLVKFIGSLKDVSVLVTTPLSNGLPLPLREGEKIVVRAFSGQNLFGFTSTVERVCKIPFNYLHLSYPEQVSGKVLRKAPRIRTQIITTVQNGQAGDNANLSGVISNLSATGAALDAPRSFGRTGDNLTLAFRVSLHDVETYLTVNAAVRAITSHTTPNGVGMVRHGVEFQDLEPNGNVILQSLIYRQMVESPQDLI